MERHAVVSSTGLVQFDSASSRDSATSQLCDTAQLSSALWAVVILSTKGENGFDHVSFLCSDLDYGADYPST